MMADHVVQGGGTLVLALLPCWPLLAVGFLSLISARRLEGEARILAVGGALATAIVTPLLPGQDGLADAARILAAAIPALHYCFARAPVRTRTTAMMPFLMSFCTMVAVGMQALLPSVALLAFTVALQALNEAAGAARARLAWDRARLQLGGAILALLGAVLIGQGHMAPPSLGMAMGVNAKAGELLLAIGLCLLAGVGDALETQGDVPVVGMIPRIGALACMLRLEPDAVIHTVLLVVGLAALWRTVLAVRVRAAEAVGPNLSVALVILCAGATGVMPAAIICLVAAVILAAPFPHEQAARWMASALPPGPLFGGALGLIAGLAAHHPVAAVLTAAALALHVADTPLTGPIPSSRLFWLIAAWGLSAPLLLTWPVPLLWRAT